jgi:hypothetical protein
MAEISQKQTVIDNIDAAEIYVNKIVGSSFDGTTVGVTLGCTRVVPERLNTTPSSPPVVYVAGRLSLTPAAAADLVKGLSGILAAISKGPGQAN